MEAYETTPRKITPEILAFCKTLPGAEGDATYIPVRSVPGAPVAECYIVTEKYVKENGGKLVHGWCIWEWEFNFLNCEHHAVWESPNGELVNVAPMPDGEQRIVFQPAPTHVYKGSRINHVFHPLRDHEAIKEYIQLTIKSRELMPDAGAIAFSEMNQYNPIFTVENRRSKLMDVLRKMTDVRRQSRKEKQRRR